MIPTYNRTAFLERALSSVLAQDPGAGEMQIEVVDNASTIEDPEPLVRRLGGDRVSFVRQPHNLGAVLNFNSCIERSRGEWVHILPSDDVVFRGFYARLKTALEGRVDVGAAFCRNAFIDENDHPLWNSELESPTAGILPDFIEKIGVSSRIQCPTAVVRRSVYEQLGGFRTEFISGDWEIWIRIAARYPIWYEPEILGAWRQHTGSYSTSAMRSGRLIADIRRCIEFSHFSLPPDRADAISRKAREWLSLSALANAENFVRSRDFPTALHLIREGLKCAVSSRSMKALFLVGWRATMIGRNFLRDVFWDIFINRTFPLRKRLGLRRRTSIQHDVR
jgi:glycosyltransferase involved in cell wall biosynthesis